MPHIVGYGCNEHTEVLEVGYEIPELLAHCVGLEEHLSEGGLTIKRENAWEKLW